MEDLDLADPELAILINIQENKVCNDCQKKNPRWCSINNAVLLCASCTRKHRKFNEYISKIKSLEGDLWTKDEIKRLYIGGNERFNQMLKSYNIPLTNDNAEYKYHTKIAAYYRDLLSEELKGKKVIDLVKPSLKEGIELLSKEEYDKLNQYIPSQDNILQNNNNNINNNSDVLNIPKSNIYANPFASDINNNNNNNINNINNSNIFNNNISENKFEQHLNDFADTMGTVFNNISQKAQSIDYNEKLKNAGEYIKDKKEKIENSETFKGFMSALSTGIDSLVRKTEDFFNDSLDNSLNNVNNEQRTNVNRLNNRNQNQFNFQGQRINNNNKFNNSNRNMNNNFNNNNLNKNVSNYRPINNNMNNNVPLNNINNNNVSQNNMNNVAPVNNMNNNNVVQNQNNINNNGNNNNFNNVNINLEGIDTPDGDDGIPKLIYNNSPQNLNNQGEQNNDSNNNAVNLDGSKDEKNNNDNNTESLDENNNEKNNNP
jgi:hypothetical protein